jgi:hypothetical protein
MSSDAPSASDRLIALFSALISLRGSTSGTV